MSATKISDVFARFVFDYEEQKNDPFEYTIASSKLDWFCQKIDQTLKDKKNILVWGDYDVDGIASSAMLTEVLKHVAEAEGYDDPDIACHIPGRADGYGINIHLFRSYAKQFDLIITLDNGSHDEFFGVLTDTEKENLLVFDHHPNGSFEQEKCVINPNTDGDVKISTGILVEELHSAFRARSQKYESKFSKDELSDLCALTLISDMASLNNKAVRNRIENGLRKISKRERIVYKKLLPEYQGDVTMQGVAFNLVPVLNSIGRLYSKPDVAVELLLAKEFSSRAKELLDEAIITNNFRKELTDSFSKIAYSQIESRGIEQDPLIYVHIEDAPIGINGLIASNVFNRYGRDVIVTSRNFQNGGTIVGSGRGEQIKDMLTAMKNVMDIASKVNPDVPGPNKIMAYGGHNQAIGIKIYDPNIFESLRIWSCQNLKTLKKAPSREKVHPFGDQILTIDEYKEVCNTYAVFIGGDIKYNDRFYVRIKGNVSKIKEFRNDFMEIALVDQGDAEIRFLTKQEAGANYFGFDEKIFEVEIQPVFQISNEYTIGTTLKLEKNFFRSSEDLKNEFSGGCAMRMR